MGPRNIGLDKSDKRPHLAIALTLAAAITAGGALIVVTAACGDDAVRGSVLHATCWLLVGGGVTGTFLAGAGKRSGWLVLLGMQPVWIAYAVVTGQYGFVAGSLAYAGGQLNGYVRAGTTASVTDV